MRYLLDTNVCIPIINGADAALRKRIRGHSPESITICSVVKAELLYGLRKSSRKAENEQRLRVLFAELTSFPFDDQAAEHYGIVRTILEQSGQIIGGYDMMIAAIALANDLTVATRNAREFERVVSLKIEVW